VRVPTTSQNSRQRLHRQLRNSLYRFDCPTPLAIGEYELKVSPPEQQVQVAQHILTCHECAAELAMLRAYLAPVALPMSAVPAPAAPSLTDRVRQVVARLISPEPGRVLAGVRHTGRNQIRVYEAGDLVLTLGPGLPASPGLGSLLGLFEVVGHAPVAGRVILISATGARHETTLDDLGGFEFTELPEGIYDLQIDPPDRLVVLDGLIVEAP
jgi:hypothetical protein